MGNMVLYWVPIRMGFWVGMGTILLFMGGHGWAQGEHRSDTWEFWHHLGEGLSDPSVGQDPAR
jgi:hypothetical protein